MNPQRLGSRYLLHDRLGQGAMGVVWRGQDLENGAWVAVKLLRPDYASSPAAVSRFVGERNALVRFRHPNVVNLRDMIVEGDRLALVMDLITGGDLDTFRLHNGGTLAPDIAVRMTAQICDGLAAAHAAGIVHRDLKPSNVLLQAGQVKLADFGIARITGEARRTTTGTVMGTPTYLAPEAINGAEPTNACDVYAVGITLYELLTGQPPFDGHVIAVMQAHLQRDAERISGVSDPLWDLIAACLSKDPAGRPRAADLATSLKALAENAGAGALGPGPARTVQPPAPAQSPAPAGPLAVPGPGGRQRKRLLVALTALVAVLAVAGIVYATAFSGTSTTSLTSGLTRPTVGAVTSIGQPTPGHARQGHHHAGTRAGDPTPAGSPTSIRPSHSTGHQKGKPTAPPATKPASSPPTSPTSTTSATPTPTGTPPPNGVWQCTTVPASATQNIVACVRLDGGELQMMGKLTGIAMAGDSIQLDLRNENTPYSYGYSTGFCSATVATCVTPAISDSTAGTGDYYVMAGWTSSGKVQAESAISPVIYYPGS